jgi:hypothetical protein
MATFLGSLQEDVCEALLFAAQPCLGQLGLFFSFLLGFVLSTDSAHIWSGQNPGGNLIRFLFCFADFTLRVAAIELGAAHSAWENTGHCIAWHGMAWRWTVGRSNLVFSGCLLLSFGVGS